MIRRILPLAIGAVLIGSAALGTIGWFACRIYVPEDMCVVLIRKLVEQLPSGQMVATKPEQTGIHETVHWPRRPFGPAPATLK